ncbi:MAG: LysE family transporter [Chloroflexia bacterium]|nr:LysE family transporter [Chloroflexia bacterium]
MGELIPLIVSGLAIGVAYTAVPGPVNLEATRRGLSHGFRPALSVQLGSLVGDVMWAILGLTGTVVMLQRDSLTTILGVIGAGFLFALARSAFRGALGKTDRSLTPVSGNGWKVGIMFSLANPAGIAFWSGFGGGTFGATTNAGGRGSRRDSHKFHRGFNTLRRSVRRFDRTRAPTRDWQRDA